LTRSDQSQEAQMRQQIVDVLWAQGIKLVHELSVDFFIGVFLPEVVQQEVRSERLALYHLYQEIIFHFLVAFGKSFGLLF
jgi:hypothetical protein